MDKEIIEFLKKCKLQLEDETQLEDEKAKENWWNELLALKI